MSGRSRAVVDVIVPTRNRPELTADAIESVRAQTMPNWRLIVVDDHSDAAAVEALRLIAACDERITLVERTTCGGAQQARQTGLGISTAPFIAILDSDDLWEPAKLELQLDLYHHAVTALPKLGAVLCGHVWCDESGSPVGRPRVPSVHGRATPLTSDNMSAVLIRRQQLLDAGGFLPPGEVSRPGANHIDFFIRLSRRCEMCVVPRVLVRCRRHNGVRDSDVLHVRAGAENLAYLLQRHADYLSEFPRDYARLCGRTGARFLSVGARREGFRYLRLALRTADVSTKLKLVRRYGPYAASKLLRSGTERITPSGPPDAR